MALSTAPALPDRPWLHRALFVALGAYGVWSFLLALRFPIDSWDAYDYLVNARWLAGHDLTRLAQRYRPDRPPGISLLAAPLLAVGYQPGQRGLTGLLHLVPWSLGLASGVVLFRQLSRTMGTAVACLGVLLLALNPLTISFLPYMMADVASMAFAFFALVMAERVIQSPSRRLLDGGLLAAAIAAALCTKYPVAALGLTIPLASALSAMWGEGRGLGLKGVVLGVLRPRLAVSLLLGLAAFFAVHAVIYSSFVDGPGPWWAKLENGLRTAWSGGGGSGDLDPWWEIPSVVWWTCGPPAVLLALWGLGVSVVKGELRGLLHGTWALGFVALFVFVIGHRESRYAMPVLPSVVWLSMRGLSTLPVMSARVAAAIVALVGIAAPAAAEFGRMSDPLYTRPSILAWARAALDAAGSDRPIIQNPLIQQFGLYPKNPVVFPTDEYWHYSHFNEGGLVWFFDRRLFGLRVLEGPASQVYENSWAIITVPPEWLRALGEDAVWLSGFPKGAVIVTSNQQWFETRTAAQQPEPPPPFTMTDVRHVKLTWSGDGERVRYEGEGVRVEARKTEGGWTFAELPADSRWFVPQPGAMPRRLASIEPELPAQLEGILRIPSSFPIRP